MIGLAEYLAQTFLLTCFVLMLVFIFVGDTVVYRMAASFGYGFIFFHVLWLLLLGPKDND